MVRQRKLIDQTNRKLIDQKHRNARCFIILNRNSCLTI